jgi:hypothetical protein
MASPRDRIQALGLNLFLAGRAEAEGRRLNAIQRVVDQMEHAPIVVALVEEEFLGVGIRGLIGNILSAFFVRFSSILFGFRYQAQQLCLFGKQTLPENFSLSLVHALP